ncbi:Protein FATTY ACID EXPORT 1- chloroplastic [Striga hermonthica]|uniref:Protein FATTY ACID EXPORT 1- chloroplastic n=1 Tax=Striga hermonthica TaxID=68872 RepID=A0A9N7R2Z7_STRHE|nr:Protein FATTY ACID EXPORT 1- chloroplastic [Striga hermonthica]
MPSAIAQMSCFSSIISNRRLQHRPISFSRPDSFRPGKVLNVMSNDGSSPDISNLESKAGPSSVKDELKSHNGTVVKSRPLTEGSVIGASNGHAQEQVISLPKRAAKIHDFCFGIPFGGIVLSGGLLGFIFTRNPVSLRTGVLYGGALLALSTISLKVWRQGKSSLPFILGQAVLAIALLQKNFQAYSLTKKLFPTGFSIAISAAMFCFYSYVVLSGGNPPPKKLQSSASVGAS